MAPREFEQYSTDIDEDDFFEHDEADLDPEVLLDFNEDHIAEHEQRSGIYESIEEELEYAVDEATIEDNKTDEDVLEEATTLEDIEYLDNWIKEYS